MYETISMLNRVYICFKLMFVQRNPFLQDFFLHPIPDRRDQVHHFMAPLCSTCRMFTFVFVSVLPTVQ